MGSTLVSVIILTRDREADLQRCVESIIGNTYDNTEIVIFDNSSEPSKKLTRDFLSALRCECSIMHIESFPKGFAEMRQTAVKHSTGEIIVSIDDDCVADRDAIARIVERFASDQTIGIIGGQITNVGFEGRDQFQGRGRIGVNGRWEAVQDPRDATVFGSANMSIRRKAFDRVGGYDLFFSGGLEEADLTLSLKRTGYKVVYESSVRITHFYTPSRYRPKWRIVDIYRLYLFFKHFMPQTLSQWLRFFTVEAGLVAQDLVLRVLKRLQTSREGILRAMRGSAKALILIIVGRLSIPYVVHSAVLARHRRTQNADQLH